MKLIKPALILLFIGSNLTLTARNYKIEPTDTIINNFIYGDEPIHGVSTTYNLRRNDHYTYGNGVVDYCVGKAIRSLAGWIQGWCNEESKILIFEDPSPTLLIEISPEATKAKNEASVNEQLSIFNEVPFKFYPPYSCCDFAKLFAERKTIILYLAGLRDHTEIYVQTHSYVPIPIEKTDDDNLNMPNYIHTWIDYEYKLDWICDGSDKSVDTLWNIFNKINNLEKSDEAKQKDFLKTYSLMFLKGFKWQLSLIDFRSLNKIFIDSKNLPYEIKNM